MLCIVGVVFWLAAAVALYFFIEKRKLQAKLRTELRDIHGGDSGMTQTYRRVDGASNNTFSGVDNE